MVTLIMAYGFDFDNDKESPEQELAEIEEIVERDTGGSCQSAYEINKGMVPLTHLFNAGTSKSPSEF